MVHCMQDFILLMYLQPITKIISDDGIKYKKIDNLSLIPSYLDVVFVHLFAMVVVAFVDYNLAVGRVVVDK